MKNWHKEYKECRWQNFDEAKTYVLKRILINLCFSRVIYI